MRAWGTSQVHSTRRDHEHRTRPRTCADPIDWIRSRSERNLILKYTGEMIRYRNEVEIETETSKWSGGEQNGSETNIIMIFLSISSSSSSANTTFPSHNLLPSTCDCLIFYLPDLMESNHLWGFTAEEFFNSWSSFFPSCLTRSCAVSR